MPDRFDNFTGRARRALAYAQEEARRFNHKSIGTEHLLLALVRQADGVAAKVLANMGVELGRVRSAVELIIGRGDRMPPGDLALTPQAEKVIELAVDEARRMGRPSVGTEHLLLGLVREEGGIAAMVLETLGVSLDKVRAQVIHVLRPSSTSSQHEPHPLPKIVDLAPGLDFYHKGGAIIQLADGTREQWMMDPAEMGSDHRSLPAPLSARLPPGARVLRTFGSEAQEDAYLAIVQAKKAAQRAEGLRAWRQRFPPNPGG